MDTYLVVVNAQNDFLEPNFNIQKPQSVEGARKVCKKISELLMSVTIKNLVLIREEHEFVKENVLYCNRGTWGAYIEDSILRVLQNCSGNKTYETTNDVGNVTVKTKGKCTVFVTGISHKNSVELVASNIKEQNPDAIVYILKDYVAGGIDPFEVARGELIVK